MCFRFETKVNIVILTFVGVYVVNTKLSAKWTDGTLRKLPTIWNSRPWLQVIDSTSSKLRPNKNASRSCDGKNNGL